MHVLICDDDAATRFVIKRLLTQNFGCSTTECVDGVEALRKLDDEEVDLILLDVEMPLIDGIEVLEAIRNSPQLKTLPVLMLSKERREEAVVKLVRLGIEGYILKPPRTEKVLAALERLRGTLSVRRTTGRSGNVGSIRLGPDTPAMLVDGNLDYRHFFAQQGSKHGPIMEAGSGASALAHFRTAPTRLVFLGSDLGILTPDLLVPKLRAMAGSQPVRIVGIVEASQMDNIKAHFDDVMVRTYIPEKFKTELRRFTRVPGPLAAVTTLAGDLSNNVASAARQVFGMMLDAEIETLEDVTEKDPMIAAISDINIQQRYIVKLGIRATLPSIKAIAGRMLGMEISDLGEEDYLSTAAELANLVSGRMHANLDERQVHSDCSLPQLDREAKVWNADSAAEDGVVVKFKVTGSPANIVMSLQVIDLLGESADAVAAAAAAGDMPDTAVA